LSILLPTPFYFMSFLIDINIITVESFYNWVMLFIILFLCDKISYVRYRNRVYKKFGRLRLGTI